MFTEHPLNERLTHAESTTEAEQAWAHWLCLVCELSSLFARYLGFSLSESLLYMALPAHNHEFPFRCPWPDVGPQVHGEDGAGTVKYGGEGGHESRHHHSHHEPTESWEAEGRSIGLGLSVDSFCLLL